MSVKTQTPSTAEKLTLSDSRASVPKQPFSISLGILNTPRKPEEDDETFCSHV
jgi:hypothetical protein